MAWFFITFFSIYALLHFYLLKRLLRVGAFFPKPVRIGFIVLFFHLSLSYILSRSLLRNMDIPLYDFFLFSGSIWFSILLYSIIGMSIAGLIRRFLLHTQWYNLNVVPRYAHFSRLTFLAVLSFTAVCTGYGYYNAHNVVITRVSIDLPKKHAVVDSLTVMFFSDSHFTPLNNASLALKLKALADQLNPDVILMAGDIVDDQNHHLRRHAVAEAFRGINSKFGAFTAPGNHEYIVGIDSGLAYLREMGITVLRDSSVVIAGSVRVTGRDDSSRYRMIGSHRKPLQDLITKNDTLPVIVLDHQPFRLNETMEAGASLQLSGHTHHGQLFPMNLITSIIYEVSYGYKKKETMQVFVSSGAGTWGPPVRTGSPAEVVFLTITFK